MATLFIVLGILFVIGLIYLGIKWFKSEPKTNVGNNGGGVSGGSNVSKKADVLMLHVTDDILFGRDGVLVKGETFYEGVIAKNSQLYLPLSVFIDGAVRFCGINDNDDKPKMQIALEMDGHRSIANPCNDKRQSVQNYIIRDKEYVWVSSDVLNQVDLPEYFVIRIMYRLDDGEGYGEWKTMDSVNIHNIK